jgi:HPt (histidine-containing phosphotransfer) domain-containing protein
VSHVIVDYACIVEDMTQTFSSDDLVAMIGSDAEMLLELRAIFEEEAPRVLGQIFAAVSTRNAGALEHHTHLMKNVVASVGGRASQELAMTLERAARAHDLDPTADLADRLAREIDALREALATFISARIDD